MKRAGEGRSLGCLKLSSVAVLIRIWSGKRSLKREVSNHEMTFYLISNSFLPHCKLRCMRVMT